MLGVRRGHVVPVGTLMARISQHAAERYVERIAPGMTLGEAEAVMMRSAAAIDLAAAFGATGVRLPCGARLVLRGGVVVTVRGKFCTYASDTMMKRWRRQAKVRSHA